MYSYMYIYIYTHYFVAPGSKNQMAFNDKSSALITGHPCEQSLMQPLAELRHHLHKSSGFADPRFCQSVVITLGDEGASMAKAIQDFHTMKCLSAIQGTY